MKTTFDLPEDLLLRAKATAARRGMKLSDLVAELLGAGLTATPEQEPRRGHRGLLPVMIPATGRKIPILTNAQIFELLDREDDEEHGRTP